MKPEEKTLCKDQTWHRLHLLRCERNLTLNYCRFDITRLNQKTVSINIILPDSTTRHTEHMSYDTLFVSCYESIQPCIDNIIQTVQTYIKYFNSFFEEHDITDSFFTYEKHLFKFCKLILSAFTTTTDPEKNIYDIITRCNTDYNTYLQQSCIFKLNDKVTCENKTGTISEVLPGVPCIINGQEESGHFYRIKLPNGWMLRDESKIKR